MIGIHEAQQICLRQQRPVTKENVTNIILSDIEDRAAMTGRREMTPEEINNYVEGCYGPRSPTIIR